MRTLFLFLTVQATIAFAQKNHIVKLVPEPDDVGSYDFYIDSVVDNRLMKENIGMAQVGLSNRQVEAVFEQPFEPTLFHYLSNVCKRASNQKKLVAVFETLSITEKTYQLKEIGIAEIKITFCLRTDSQLYKVNTFEYTQQSGGMDVTAGQAKRIKIAIKNCLQQLQTWGIKPTEPYRVQGSWAAQDNEHHILRCSTRVHGVYTDINELRSNSPSVTDFTFEPAADLYLLRGTDGKKAKEPYGFCDGKKLYINTFFYNPTNPKARYAQVQEEGRYLMWMDHYVSAGEAAAMQAAFGIIGQAAAKSGLDIIILDLKTGVILPVTKKNSERIFRNHQDLLKDYQATGGKLDLIANLIRELNKREAF